MFLGKLALLVVSIGILSSTHFFSQNNITFGITGMSHDPTDNSKDIKRLEFFLNESVVALNNEDKKGALNNLLVASLLNTVENPRASSVFPLINDSVFLLGTGDTQMAKDNLMQASHELHALGGFLQVSDNTILGTVSNNTIDVKDKMSDTTNPSSPLNQTFGNGQAAKVGQYLVEPPFETIEQPAIENLTMQNVSLISDENMSKLSSSVSEELDSINESDSSVSKGEPELSEEKLVNNNQTSGTNHPPTTNDVNAETTKASPVDIQIEASDVDPNDELKVVIVSGPASGTVQVNQDTGVVSYTPKPEFAGKDTFTFKINDGTADSYVATGSITVNESDSSVSKGEPELSEEKSIETQTQVNSNEINLTSSNEVFPNPVNQSNLTMSDSTMVPPSGSGDPNTIIR